MTSSDRSDSPVFRRILWLGIGIVIAIAAYVGGWYYMANRLRLEVDRTLASLNRGGSEARCENADVRGFPFRLGLFCGSVTYADPAQTLTFSAGAFRSAAQVYDPATIVGELDGPMELQVPGLVPLSMGWELMHASVRLDQPVPAAISVEGRQVVVSEQNVTGAELFTAENAQLHMRTNEADIDLAGRFVGLRLPGLPAETPPMQAEANLTVLDGLALAAAPEAIALGYKTQIRALSLSFGPDAAVTASGPLAVDSSGLIDAQLTLTARQPAEIARFLSTIFPDQEREIEMAASGLAMLGNSPSLPLNIAKGRASIAFITLGDIPALRP